MCAAAFFTTLTTKAQTSLPYFTGFDNSLQQAGWQEFRKGDPAVYQWTLTNMSPYSSSTHLRHDYPVGGTFETNDWYVSPPFNFSAGGKIDSVRAYFSGFSKPGDFYDDTVAIYLLQGSPDPALATSHTLLFDFRGANYQNDDVWRKFSNISIPPTAGQSYIAFYYKTVISWLDVRFDNLSLSANALVPVANFSVPAGICKGKAVVFNDASSNTPNSWYWEFAGGTPSVSTVANPTVVFQNAGSYTVNLVASNGMGGNSVNKNVTVSSCTGVNDISESSDISIYPNPAREEIYLRSDAALSGKATLVDVTGRPVQMYQADKENAIRFDLRRQSAGLYFIVLETEESRQVFKLIHE